MSGISLFRLSATVLIYLQDGAEPSAVSITLANLQRLAHLAEDRHADYNAKAKSILSSNGQLLTRAPFALASMVSAAIMADKGYVQVRSRFMLSDVPRFTVVL